jgi:teichuronic acid biosynthesis glycosyltransferase TuaC
MRTVTFTTLYPNESQPRHGIFIEQRLRHLLETGQVESRVVAPVPWFPFKHDRFGKYSVFARVPLYEERYGIRIWHPRYPLIPKLGESSTPLLMALGAKPVLDAMQAEGFDFDVIDAHYLYPDGVAAALLARWLGKPMVCSVLGDDVITHPKFRLPRRMILWAVRRSSGVSCVCQALRDRLIAVGAPADKVEVVLQGVDLDLFRPMDRDTVRRRLGLTGTVLISVGHATPRKGHHLAIEALVDLPGTTLLIAGDGWYEPQLRKLAAEVGVADRVRFLGHVDQEDLKELYSAADALVLASSREGIANVLMETMACGTPVIATPVWGTPEAITVPEAGVLMSDRSVRALVEAARELFANYPDRAATRRHAGTFPWERTCKQLLDLLRRAMEGRGLPQGWPVRPELPASTATRGARIQ